MAEPPAGSGRDLPAAYRSPWLALRDDLLAVAATLSLGWRRLWRRNRQGDLPLPAFWPRSLAGLFWPLLLVLPLTLAVAALLWLRPAGWPAPTAVATPAAASAPGPVAGAGATPASAPIPAAPSAPAGSGAATTTPPPDGTLPSVATDLAAAPVAGAPASADLEPAREPVAAPQAARVADPLLQAFADADPDDCIRAATTLPQRQQLNLSLAARFLSLPVARRRQLAESWFRQAAALGYDHLVLRDGRERLLGRDALIGSGMILLDDGFPS